MLLRKITLAFAVLITTSSCASTVKRSTAAEPTDTAWLEEVEGEKALTWVRTQNDRTQKQLEADPRFKKFLGQLEKIAMAKDRIPFAWNQGDNLYNFWRDEKSVRGILRKSSYATYLKGKPKWKTVLDLDALAKAENENWVYGGIECLPNSETRCLISLSRGGKDAEVVREFDLSTEKFVTNGFQIPEAKSSASWWDKDTLLVGTDWGAGTLTKSGYPRQVRVWKRGQELNSLPLLFEAREDDISAGAFVVQNEREKHLFISRQIDFFNQEVFWSSPNLDELRQLPLPSDVKVLGIFQGQLMMSLRQPWRDVIPGDVVSFDFNNYLDSGKIEKIQVVFHPTETQAYQNLIELKNSVLVTYLDNVQTRIRNLRFYEGKWQSNEIEAQASMTMNVETANQYRDDFMMRAENFISPTQLLYWSNAYGKPKTIMQMPARFDAKGLVIEQSWATSKDGTHIPYFEVYRKGADKTAPTMLTAYGGFEVASTPYYSGGIGKVWLERGGRYVMANIRGGSEFGPNWHKQAIKENRPKVFEDFIAVSEDLIRRGRTTPAQLGISGGSNGGLLVSAVMDKRPELFGAVACSVPLTDMLNYHKWLAGASWMGEYGNPDDKKMREVLLSYSPLHNLKAEATYPEILFITSTKDDRVHPAHARKMAYRMAELGKPFLYYENIEGGHGAAANLKQAAYRNALMFTYLSEKLGLK